MKILLSCYACEPGKGSEPAIGWKWALELAKNRNLEIYVLTRLNNRESINAFWEIHTKPDNLTFYYFDLPKFWLALKAKGLSVNIYYYLWQYKLVRYAKKLHEDIRFDIVHHLTFGVFRVPSFLYKIQIPLIFGPVGGGEKSPPVAYEYFSFNNRFFEKARLLYNHLALLNPALRLMLQKSTLILTKTAETREVLSNWKSKTFDCLEVGISSELENSNRHRNGNTTFLFVGRFIYLKGIKFLLNAFKRYLEVYNVNAELLFIGKGEEQGVIEEFIKTNRLHDKIKIIPWMTQEDLNYYYETATALVFPSFHDSSGNVVLETLACGTPVICLGCGGPAAILGNTLKDLIVSTKNKTGDGLENDFANKMNQLASDPIFFDSMCQKSIERAKELTIGNAIETCYGRLLPKVLNTDNI